MIATLLNTDGLAIEVVDLDDEGPYDDTFYRGDREYELEDHFEGEYIYREVIE